MISVAIDVLWYSEQGNLPSFLFLVCSSFHFSPFLDFALLNAIFMFDYMELFLAVDEAFLNLPQC